MLKKTNMTTGQATKWITGMAVALVMVWTSLAAVSPVQGQNDGGMSLLKQAMQEAQNPIFEVVDGFENYFKTVEGFTAEIAIETRLEHQGASQVIRERYRVALARPNRIAVVCTSPTIGASLVCDGETVTMYDPTRGQYYTGAAPETLQELGGNRTVAEVLGSTPLIEMFFSNEIIEFIGGEMRGGELKGSETIGSHEAHRVEFTFQEMSWNLWIAKGEKPVLLRVQPDYMKNRQPGRNQPSYTATWTWSDWQINPEFEEGTFSLTIPDHARPVGNNKMVGQPAPDVKLPLLGGGTLDLADHRGKNVLVLDLWASWCGPCRMVLPKLAEIAESLKDEPIRFYAVNVRESNEKIESFVKRTDLSLPIAKDPQGQFASAVGTGSLPTMVVIGKNGIIQNVHVGFDPGMETSLTKELKELLAGDEVAAKGEQGDYELITESIEFKPSPFTAGSAIDFELTFKNTGEDPVKAGSVIYVMVVDGMQAYVDTIDKDIPAGGSLTVGPEKAYWEMTLASPHTSTIQVVIDPDNRLNEPDEQNNLLQTQLEVVAPGAAGVADPNSPAGSTPSPAAGATSQTAGNAGTGSASDSAQRETPLSPAGSSLQGGEL